MKVLTITCTGDCYWIDPEFVCGCVASMKEVFPVVDYAHSHIPSYPSGHIGYLLASKNKACYCTCLLCGKHTM